MPAAADRPAAVLLVAVLVAGLLGGCGDDGAAPASPPSGSVASTTPAAEPSEAAPRAAAAVLREGDLPQPWRVHTRVQGVQGVESDSCLARTGWDDGLLEGGRVQGAIHQRGAAATFARSDAYAFGDETAAAAFVDDLRAEPYRTCRAERLTAENAAAPGAAEGSGYRVAEVRDVGDAGEGGFQLQVRYQYQALVDGTLQDGNGFREDIAFRDGATVVVVLLEHVFAADEPPELVGTVADEVVTGVQAGLARARAA
ncbi:MAG TPA: hypothetical protein VNU26_09125 [Mycobacteriales bacterium]|nr:hypothetical protein [Mycobacteriales bacterium]